MGGWDFLYFAGSRWMININLLFYKVLSRFLGLPLNFFPSQFFFLGGWGGGGGVVRVNE